MVTVERAIVYLRETPESIAEADRALIEALVPASVQWLSSAGVSQYGVAAVTELYDLCQLMLIADWYEHRGDQAGPSTRYVNQRFAPQGVLSILHQLRMMEV